jgi:hypothetical protein
MRGDVPMACRDWPHRNWNSGFDRYSFLIVASKEALRRSVRSASATARTGVVHNLVAIPLFLRNILADKEVQEQIIATSSLD